MACADPARPALFHDSCENICRPLHATGRASSTCTRTGRARAAAAEHDSPARTCGYFACPSADAVLGPHDVHDSPENDGEHTSATEICAGRWAMLDCWE